MASLPEPLRRQLEKTVVEARQVGEAGARAALERLAVGRTEPFSEMAPAERELRVRLRAHARQLGDVRKESSEQEILRLVSECAYEHWHRMLFARFLAENRLLVHPDHDVAVTLAECEELAAEAGAENGWVLAGRFAARMLPAIFRPDDPVLSVRLAPEHQQALEKLLAELPAETFTASDSLGWVYQFWQTQRKKEVNESGRKIGADELPAVTQLFTEPYMVQFLLHNTLGAWWVGKVLSARPELAQAATSEEALQSACALPGYEWTYLRFIREEETRPWRPAAGTFDGWPDRVAMVTVLDPCCGSGHFLVEAFRILVPMRMVEERLSPQEAVEGVLRDNLFGLEIDERCTQIAAFNLALAAWSYPDAGGYRPLPEMHIACSGLAVGSKEDEWLKLAGKDERLREGMRGLYRLFKDAPTLGSLIDPRREKAELLRAGFEELRPLLDQALGRKEVKRDAQVAEAAIAAQGMARAADLLSGSYTLVTTNVPYLGRGKQNDALKAFLDGHYNEAKADLATAFVMRCLRACAKGGTTAAVTPQNWLFLGTYKMIRRLELKAREWNFVIRLGEHGFESSQAAGAFAALLVLTARPPRDEHAICGLDASAVDSPHEKASFLRAAALASVLQAAQAANPDSVLTFEAIDTSKLLGRFASCFQGISTGDNDRLTLRSWELETVSTPWRRFQCPPQSTCLFTGRDTIVNWSLLDSGFASAAVRGHEAWERAGVAIGQLRELPATVYTGEHFSNATPVVVPNNAGVLPAVWAFCSSKQFNTELRKLNPKLSVDNGYVSKVPFDLAHWQEVAAERYPNGLPEPESDDPTQWLFHGRPEESTVPLQVAVGRLLGYRWPPELDERIHLSGRARSLVERCDELATEADDDGIVCIPAVRGEQPAANRLQRLLGLAYGAAWTPAKLTALLDETGYSGQTLEEWLRDGFFEQHCQLFHQRPFVWHIWDGRRRDGFAALVNYHKLDRKLLERLAYTVLGDWISHQRQGVKADERGAEDRLAAAEELQRKLGLIIEGEPPYDIFVRWKALHEQPVGWEPDLNDGVRMNIRPFVEAGVLRRNPKIQWTKDRGKEPMSLRPKELFPWFWKDGRFAGERANDIHLPAAKKRAARQEAPLPGRTTK